MSKIGALISGKYGRFGEYISPVADRFTVNLENEYRKSLRIPFKIIRDHSIAVMRKDFTDGLFSHLTKSINSNNAGKLFAVYLFNSLIMFKKTNQYLMFHAVNPVCDFDNMLEYIELKYPLVKEIKNNIEMARYESTDIPKITLVKQCENILNSKIKSKDSSWHMIYPAYYIKMLAVTIESYKLASQEFNYKLLDELLFFKLRMYFSVIKEENVLIADIFMKMANVFKIPMAGTMLLNGSFLPNPYLFIYKIINSDDETIKGVDDNITKLLETSSLFDISTENIFSCSIPEYESNKLNELVQVEKFVLKDFVKPIYDSVINNVDLGNNETLLKQYLACKLLGGSKQEVQLFANNPLDYIKKCQLEI